MEFIDHRFGGDHETGFGVAHDEEFFGDIVRGVLCHQTDIDRDLSASLASGWTLRRLDSILRALLRAAAYELKKREDVPVKVVINEAVELAKRFGTGESPAFVNGILDRVAQNVRG